MSACNRGQGLLRVLDNAARAEKWYLPRREGLHGNDASPAVEESPANPISPYGIAKWVGEQYLDFFARDCGLPGVDAVPGCRFGEPEPAIPSSMFSQVQN